MTRSEMLQIHGTMLAILADPGIEVQLPERGLRRLAHAGLRADKRLYPLRTGQTYLTTTDML